MSLSKQIEKIKCEFDIDFELLKSNKLNLLELKNKYLGRKGLINNLYLSSSPDEIPSDISLKQNYPNPFNPTTTISFNVGIQSDISLSIFDLNGKLIKELINQNNINPGNYSFTWDGKNQNNIEVSSGTYICKLVSGNYSDQIKLLLIK